MAEDERVRPDDLTTTRPLDEPMSEAETRRLDASASEAETRRLDAPASEAETRRLDTPASEAETRRLDAPTRDEGDQARREPAFLTTDAEAPTRRVEEPVGPAPTERLDRGGERDRGDHERGHAVWQDERETAVPRRPAKTSAAALLGFLFGFSALITSFLGPVAVVFGLLGLLLGIVGKRRADAEARVSGRVVAIFGIVLAVLGLLLGLAVTVAVGLYANDPAVRDALTEAVDAVRSAVEGLPSFGL